MSGDAATPNQACFLREARVFLEAQAENHENENRIENVFSKVIEKGRKYHRCNKLLTNDNQLLRRAIRKYREISVDESKKNEKLQIEMVALKKRHDDMQRKLKSVQQKYRQLYQKMSAVIHEVDVELNHEDMINDVNDNSLALAN